MAPEEREQTRLEAARERHQADDQRRYRDVLRRSDTDHAGRSWTADLRDELAVCIDTDTSDWRQPHHNAATLDQWFRATLKVEGWDGQP